MIVADDGTPSAIAARNATRTIPIVFTVVNDPVASALVNTLALPGATSQDSHYSLQRPPLSAYNP